MRKALLLAGCAAVVATTAATAQPRNGPVPDTIAERVRPCAACHGQQGVATREGYFPRIAGKPAGYLYNQLVNFREGRRHNAAMTYLVEHLNDAYLKEMAGYFATLSLPYAPAPPPAVSAEALRIGEQLVRQGARERGIPACVQCHGEALTGIAPALPGLLGLPREYLIGQFGGWKTGQRKAAPPDCMAFIAARMTAEEVTAVAGWLAAQRMPADPAPAPRLTEALPMACGNDLQ